MIKSHHALVAFSMLAPNN
ncbi:hypothetical protein VCHC55A1_3192, partial [Vibrio cholerae HC-55A1]